MRTDLQLLKAFPDEAEGLFDKAEKDLTERYETYLRKSKEDYAE
ncbi:MAG: hypothetical protein V8T08_01925 [Monoglobus pectinilyticus]